MSFLTISDENIFVKTQGTKLGCARSQQRSRIGSGDIKLCFEGQFSRNVNFDRFCETLYFETKKF